MTDSPGIIGGIDSDPPPPGMTHAQAAEMTKKLAQDEDALKRVFGINFRAARIRAGLNQPEVAAATGRLQSQISEIETGKLNVTLRTMAQLAAAVQANVNDLLDPSNLTDSERVIAAATPGNDKSLKKRDKPAAKPAKKTASASPKTTAKPRKSAAKPRKTPR